MVLALSSQVLGWLLISVSLPRLPAVITSILLMLQPVGAVFLGAVLLSEAPSAVQLSGVAIVLAGVVFATIKPRTPAAASRPDLDSGAMAERFQEPGWFTRNVFNRAVALLSKLGISIAGSRVLEVRGRKSGEPRRTPVNLMTFEGERYLVAPRGHSQWVRNLRASGEGRLLVGRRAEEFRARELSDDEKPPLLRDYLKRWKWEVGQFFGGVGADAPDAELRRIAPDHPVFKLTVLADLAQLARLDLVDEAANLVLTRHERARPDRLE